MNNEKKGALIVVLLGLFFILAGVLTLLISAKLPHYTATITDITDTYTTRQLTGGGSKRRFNESVTVTYTDGEGNPRQAEKVRVKRSSESMLPKVGDSIEVKEVLGVSEYSMITPIAVFISFLLVGILLMISALRVRRKARRAQKKPQAFG